MRAIATRTFRFSPDGNRVVTYKAGDVLEGRAAEVALSMGSAQRETADAGSQRTIMHTPKNRGQQS